MLPSSTLFRLGASDSSTPSRICENHGLWVELTAKPIQPARRVTKIDPVVALAVDDPVRRIKSGPG